MPVCSIIRMIDNPYDITCFLGRVSQIDLGSRVSSQCTIPTDICLYKLKDAKGHSYLNKHNIPSIFHQLKSQGSMTQMFSPV